MNVHDQMLAEDRARFAASVGRKAPPPPRAAGGPTAPEAITPERLETILRDRDRANRRRQSKGAVLTVLGLLGFAICLVVLRVYLRSQGWE